MSRKRSRSSAKPQRDDAIIGLDVGGTVFYCHRSTVTNATGSYFAARFGQDSLIPPGDATTDDRGRDVYFIDRSGELFGHILDHLRMGGLPWKLPKKFGEDPELWRGLRAEADFYGLDELSDLLHITHTCSPALDGDRGVLHWLGTDKGAREYRNPHAIGAVRVGGWVDMIYKELVALDGNNGHRAIERPDFEEERFRCDTPHSREAIVEYRPNVKGWERADQEDEMHYSMIDAPLVQIMWCDHGFYKFPTVIDLRNIYLNPTHYSLRWAACGMDTWNFEASIDGETWNVLHRARGDEHLKSPSRKEMKRLKDLLEEESNDARTEWLISYVEKYHRHTWALKLPASSFYRYFRFTGPSRNGHHRCRCLHGVGLELYGNVHEK